MHTADSFVGSTIDTFILIMLSVCRWHTWNRLLQWREKCLSGRSGNNTRRTLVVKLRSCHCCTSPALSPCLHVLITGAKYCLEPYSASFEIQDWGGTSCSKGKRSRNAEGRFSTSSGQIQVWWETVSRHSCCIGPISSADTAPAWRNTLLACACSSARVCACDARGACGRVVCCSRGSPLPCTALGMA